MKKLTIIAAAFAAFAADAAITITGVTARQRWPWNSLVDVDFTISGAAAGEAFAIDINAEYAGGDKKLAAYTYTTEPVVAGSATHRLTWNMGKDYPNFRAEDLRVSVTATPFSSTTPVYMVIDISGGKDATTYPVRYTTTPPAHVQGAANEPCQTTEMWLRRIKAGSFKFCSNDSRPDGYFKVNLTKDFYMGIFECTQQQLANLTGTWPSYFSNETYRASRPADTIGGSLGTLYGSTTWSVTNTPAKTSLIGMVRSKAGLDTFDLPTEAQWEYASRCGYDGTRNPGYTFDTSHVRYDVSSTGMDYAKADVSTGTAYVGSFDPSPWGLYDIFGNVWETTRDYSENVTPLQTYYAEKMDPVPDPITATSVVVDDPIGTTTKSYKRVFRGGAWASSLGNLTHDTRSNPDNQNAPAGRRGVRFCVTCE